MQHNVEYLKLTLRNLLTKWEMPSTHSHHPRLSYMNVALDSFIHQHCRLSLCSVSRPSSPVASGAKLSELCECFSSPLGVNLIGWTKSRAIRKCVYVRPENRNGDL